VCFRSTAFISRSKEGKESCHRGTERKAWAMVALVGECMALGHLNEGLDLGRNCWKGPFKRGKRLLRSVRKKVSTAGKTFRSVGVWDKKGEGSDPLELEIEKRKPTSLPKRK